MKNNIAEAGVTVALIGIAVLLLNPLNFWMPDILVICMLAITLALCGVFASFVLRERSYDERDEHHRSLAGRNAFLAGAGVLIIGVVVQGYSHTVDPWLILALIAMVVVKIGTRLWADKNR